MGIDYYQLGIETGKMAAKILKGEEKASTLRLSQLQRLSFM